MQGRNTLDEIARADPQYAPDAYLFVMEALAHTVHTAGERRHVTGRELLYGIRDLALDAWGMLARHVFESWGVHTTDDFGEIVFRMVEGGVLSKTDSDKRQDFRNVFTFDDAFGRARAPELDERGHIRRKSGPARLDGPAAWTSFFNDSGAN
jgi:uncharacterized repeat protein (TIGR04138 family)